MVSIIIEFFKMIATFEKKCSLIWEISWYSWCLPENGALKLTLDENRALFSCVACHDVFRKYVFDYQIPNIFHENNLVFDIWELCQWEKQSFATAVTAACRKHRLSVWLFILMQLRQYELQNRRFPQYKSIPWVTRLFVRECFAISYQFTILS